jgi:hypothetical protein
MQRLLSSGLLLTSLLLASACGDKEDPIGDDTGTPVQDADGDGFSADEDCDDGDAEVHPGAEETCDEVDNDCDGEVDEDVSTTWYPDLDGDGWGDEEEAIVGCEQTSGTVTEPGDCDDQDAESYPGAPERCDGQDNDCDGEVDNDPVDIWYVDADGDGHGNAAYPQNACDPGSGWVSVDTDCDDTDAEVHPDADELCNGIDDDCDELIDGDDEDITDQPSWYRDGDGDGYGVEEDSLQACDQPSGYAALAGDCDDGDPAFNPAAAETDCADPNDYNCDGSTSYTDRDGDGWAACEECDDRDAAQHPGADELCNGEDDDCDGNIDEDDAIDGATWYADDDDDGYGDPLATTTACSQPSDYVTDATDCDDNDDDINPGAAELCDGIDNDCDGDTDEDSAADASTWYLDVDGDGYGDPTRTTAACSQPSGYASDASDCDDHDGSIHPGATELCNGDDDDCDGTIDESSAADAGTWYADNDGDGYGDPGSTRTACSQPSGYEGVGTDCDDSDSSVNPGATELCNGHDDDCDGSVDEGDASDAATWYADADADSYGDPTSPTTACSRPSGHVSDATDCDDHDDDINPGAAELCNGADDDCDGSVDESDAIDTSTWYADADGDGYGDPVRTTTACSQPTGYAGDDTDCDDGDGSIHPGAADAWYDGVDSDCDGDDDYDRDADGYRHASYGGTDCDDSDASTYPGAADSWYDGVDSDCAGNSDYDADADGYDHDGFGGTDCDDGDSAINPGAADTWYDGVDSDCAGDSDYDADLDGHDSDAYGGDDCDDTDISLSPSEPEACDGIDNDCDGAIDEDDGTGGLCSVDFVLFVTDAHVGSSSSSWHNSRSDADSYCGSYAASAGISGSDFRVVYSTPSEDARDFLDYDASMGDRVFDRNGTQVDGGDLWGGGSVSLPDMVSWTITSTQSDGTFYSCSGSYPDGSWPMCQYCSEKFACGSSSADPFNPDSCCWTGTRAIVCMGAL